MSQALRRHWLWILTWFVLTVLGSMVLARLEVLRLRDAFETDARIAHRLLSQRVVQHDAIIATLGLLQSTDDGTHPEQRLASVYPQILTVQRRDHPANWPDERLLAAETVSRALSRPALTAIDFAKGRYYLVLASQPASYAMQIDLRTTVPWSEWPMAAERSPVRVTLEQDGQSFVIQPGRLREGGWRFEFHKHLAADSQPFDMVAVQRIGAADLPWLWALLLSAVIAAGLAVMRNVQRHRQERRRAEELLRLGQVARLNALGELAAGMAHELNQPLTAVLANTQAATRMLVEEPPDMETARHAMSQAVEQAQRASGVVARLRRVVEHPDRSTQLESVDLQQAVNNALYLLEPEFKRREVNELVEPSPTPLLVMADPVALEQVIHNLLMNALQALEQMTQQARQVKVAFQNDGAKAMLSVADNGPGIPSALLPRIFEPFFTTRGDGLGLGLSLCETLATGMGGELTAANGTPRGAMFTLALPLAGVAK